MGKAAEQHVVQAELTRVVAIVVACEGPPLFGDGVGGPLLPQIARDGRWTGLPFPLAQFVVRRGTEGEGRAERSDESVGLVRRASKRASPSGVRQA